MMDLTDVIGPLSLAFQANELLVIDVIPIVEARMLKLSEMKHSPSECISTIVHGFEHEGILLRGPVEPELKQLHKRIIDSAIDQIDLRFKALQQSPLSDFAVLDYRQWPHDKTKLALYGKEKLESLVKHFTPVLTEEEVNFIPREFADFKVCVSKQKATKPNVVFRDMLLMPPESCKHFMSLVQIMLTISMSTAVVERGFSHMNIVKSSTRTLLGNGTMNNLLEIKLNEPSTKDLYPASAILH